MGTTRPSPHWTPLAVISGALALVDAALSVSSAISSGALQWFLACSAVVLAFGIVAGFFYTLWRRPETLHPPEAYATPEHMRAYGALLGRSGTAPVPPDLASKLQEAIDAVRAQREVEGPIGLPQHEFAGPAGVTGAALLDELSPRQFLTVEFAGDLSARAPLTLMYDSSVRVSGILAEVYSYLHPEPRLRRGQTYEEFYDVFSFFEGSKLIKPNGVPVYIDGQTDPEISLHQAGIHAGDTLALVTSK